MTPVDRALCSFAVHLTRDPGAVAEADIESLREHGLDDRAIHDLVAVVCLFNFYTRLAEGLGVELEPESLVRPWGEMGLDSGS